MVNLMPTSSLPQPGYTSPGEVPVMQRQPLRRSRLLLPCVFALVACGGGGSRKVGGQDGGGGATLGEVQDGNPATATGGTAGTFDASDLDGAAPTGGSTGGGAGAVSGWSVVSGTGAG